MFDRLLWHCLQPGEYEFTEQGLTVKLLPSDKKKEAVLLFQLDSEEVRHGLDNKRICDLLFFYRRRYKLSISPPLLFFVELKSGTHFQHAYEQLKNAIKVVKEALHERCHDYKIRAIMVLSQSAPAATDQREMIQELKKERVLLKFESEAYGRTVDLRQYLSLPAADEEDTDSE